MGEIGVFDPVRPDLGVAVFRDEPVRALHPMAGPDEPEPKDLADLADNPSPAGDAIEPVEDLDRAAAELFLEREQLADAEAEARRAVTPIEFDRSVGGHQAAFTRTCGPSD